MIKKLWVWHVLVALFLVLNSCSDKNQPKDASQVKGDTSKPTTQQQTKLEILAGKHAEIEEGLKIAKRVTPEVFANSIITLGGDLKKVQEPIYNRLISAMPKKDTYESSAEYNRRVDQYGSACRDTINAALAAVYDTLGAGDGYFIVTYILSHLIYNPDERKAKVDLPETVLLSTKNYSWRGSYMIGEYYYEAGIGLSTPSDFWSIGGRAGVGLELCLWFRTSLDPSIARKYDIATRPSSLHILCRVVPADKKDAFKWPRIEVLRWDWEANDGIKSDTIKTWLWGDTESTFSGFVR